MLVSVKEIVKNKESKWNIVIFCKTEVKKNIVHEL
jgi:hypothetical protein